MKKSLFAIAALAVAGIGFAGCDFGTTNPDPCNGSCVENQVCAETVNKGALCVAEDDYNDDDCTNGLYLYEDQINNKQSVACAAATTCEDGTTCEVGKYCVSALKLDDTTSFEWGCAAVIPLCPENMSHQWQEDGSVLCITDEVATCTDDDGCEDDYICVENQCVPGTREESTDYTFVRIDDLTPANKACCGNDDCGTPAVCTKDDPGADIDAIALVKADKTVKYVSTVKEYKNAFLEGGTFYKEGNIMALDSKQIEGEPDSIVGYNAETGNPADVTCKYTHTGTQTKAEDYPFVSLGGEGGYIVVQMDGVIEAGDKLDVLEVGDCKLSNAEDSNGVKAQKEDIKVQVSITAADGSWRTVLEKGQADNGLISATITAESLK